MADESHWTVEPYDHDSDEAPAGYPAHDCTGNGGVGLLGRIRRLLEARKSATPVGCCDPATCDPSKCCGDGAVQ
jgi:hypothetical protein